MYLSIPFTLGKRVQSDTTPVLKTRAPYCHHHHSASADSTEYWIWNGPDHHNSDEDGGIQEDTEHDNTEETISTNLELYSPPDNCSPSLLSRPEQNDIFYDPPSFDKQCNDSSLLKDDSTSSDEAYSFSSDLPSESFSPLLRQSLRTLDTLPTGSDSPLRGLGIFNLTRNGDASRPFDGLGVVHVRSGQHQRVQEEGQEDEDELSPTFLHDLEAFFLVKDFGQPSFDAALEAPTIRVEDSPMATPRMEEQLVAPPASPATPLCTRSSLTSKIKHTLRPRGPSVPGPTSVPAMNSIPRSLTTSALSTASSTTVSASTSTSSTTSVSSTSSFVRRACSAFRSQYSLNALRAEHAAKTGSPRQSTSTRTSPIKRRSGVCSSPIKSGDTSAKKNKFQPVPLVGPTRKVSVSVSMGESPRPITPMKSGSKRSLQTHCVRDSKDWREVRDTISSELKKRERK